ncbi:ferredoxin [Candidatus Woesearchaeota archaeon]|jgi:ferredoxin|nr:ferredoxin [Candidatus Woesearchaeota archaeon]|tara:strand:+ start:2046 stop:2321 length:276 start_codon:yes stop_codon:yes gene_type:complete
MSHGKDSASSKKYKVVFDKEGCIGAAACVAADPENWKLQDDGKSSLKKGKEVKGQFEREITEEELQAFKDAAENCPVNVIHIFDEDGKRII